MTSLMFAFARFRLVVGVIVVVALVPAVQCSSCPVRVVTSGIGADQATVWPTPFAEADCTLNTMSNTSGQCSCNQLLDIRCTGVDRVPEFGPDDRIYSAIDLSDQGISSLPRAAFSGLKVRKVVLNFNPIEDGLDAGAWSGLESVLQELHLGDCRIRTLPNGMLNIMFELRHLHMWNNKITSIAPNYFKDCCNLRELLLWGNRIERIDQDSFAGLWNLRRLDLDRNRILSLSKDAFKHLTKLEVIHLGENRIREISSDTFKHTTNLKVLSLDGNGLEHIYPKAFSGLSGLLSLALHDNNINFLPTEGLFVNMTQLTTLLLRRNRLETVWPRTFNGLRSLSRLDLSDNRLSSLPDGMLMKSARLRHVWLDNNQLKTISKCSVTPGSAPGRRGQQPQQQQQQQPLRHLRTLSLMGNPGLVCDCRLTWLVDIRERDGVSVWGTCSASRHHSSISVINRRAYDPLLCSYSPVEC